MRQIVIRESRKEIPWERWQESSNAVARINLPNMQSPDRRKVEVYAQAVQGLIALEQDGDKRAKYLEFIDIYAGLTDNEFRLYQQRYPEESNSMAGVIQRARDEGMRQGEQQGERTVLERQLRRRFGILSSGIAEKLQQASTTELETWAENVLDAETLDQVFERRD